LKTHTQISKQAQISKQSQDKGVVCALVDRKSKLGTLENREESGGAHALSLHCYPLVTDLAKHLPASQFESLAGKLKTKGSRLGTAEPSPAGESIDVSEQKENCCVRLSEDDPEEAASTITPIVGEASTMQLAKRTKNGNEGWECKFVIPYERELTASPTHERFEFRQLNVSVTPPPLSTQVESADGENPSVVLISQVFFFNSSWRAAQFRASQTCRH
jgi:hypothetical protein